MRSCEYLKVHGERKTELLQVADIHFFQNKQDITSNLPSLHLADFICITFREQKNGIKHETITLSRTDDPILCPVVQAAAIIRRILSIPGTSPHTTLNTYNSGRHTYGLTSDTAIQRLRRKATQIGSDRLGFQATDIGLHSLRSSAAMAMVLAGVPTYMVMLIGRWKSDAFLTYIRQQVAEFSNTVSKRMITVTSFFHPPDSQNLHTPFTSRYTLAGREAQATAAIPQNNQTQKARKKLH